MKNELCIIANEVLSDIRSAAWLESELHQDLDRHRRHQMADICEEGNIERVRRILGVSEAEIRLTLQNILVPDRHSSHTNVLEQPDFLTFRFLFPLRESSLTFLKEKIHDYMVAAVMADRSAVIIPECAAIWQERADAALASILQFAATTRQPCHPVRRPLWPL